MPSISSDFPAAVSLTLPSQMPTTTPSQDSGSQSFAALLDASTVTPAPAMTANPPAATISSPANQPQAAVNSPTSNGQGADYSFSVQGTSGLSTAATTTNAQPNTNAPTDPTANGGLQTGVKQADSANIALANALAALGLKPTDGTAGRMQFASTNLSANANSASGQTASGDAAAYSALPAQDSPSTMSDPTTTSVPSAGAPVAVTAESTSAATATAIVTAAATDQSGAATPDQSPPGNKKASDSGNDQNSDGTTDSGAAGTPAAPQLVPAAAIAAAVVPITAFAATPATGNGPATTTEAIGAQARGRANLADIASQLASSQQTSQAPQSAQNGSAAQLPAQPAIDGKHGADAAAAKQSAVTDAAAAPPPSDTSAQASNSSAVAPAGDSAAAPPANLVVPRINIASDNGPAGSSSSAQNAAAAVKSAAGNLPDFAVVATNSATAAQTAAATPATAPAAAVSIAGLPIAIATRAQAGSNQFEIRLDPPELGRIDVRLDVDSSGQVTSHVTVDRPDTLTLLQSQQPQLERALEQAGLKTADNGLQFSLRDQSFAGGGNGGNAQSNQTPQLVIPDSDLPPVDTTQIYARWGLGGGIDIRV